MIIRDAKRAKIAFQKETILEASEAIWTEVNAHNFTKRKLAHRMGKSAAYITQTLNGTRNMTIRTLADYAFALGCTVKITLINPAPTEPGRE